MPVLVRLENCEPPKTTGQKQKGNVESGQGLLLCQRDMGMIVSKRLPSFNVTWSSQFDLAGELGPAFKRVTTPAIYGAIIRAKLRINY